MDNDHHDRFEARFRELESMVGSDVSMGLFNEVYEVLLNEVNALPVRYEKLERMQHLLMKQAEFLMNEWLRAKAIDKIAGSGSGVTEKGMN